jgi:LmbE family N-acetylglucosaminyl deacetylase
VIRMINLPEKARTRCGSKFKTFENTLKKTTHLGIVAHPDDLEIGVLHGILKGRMKWAGFSGIVVTNGAGSPRSGFGKFAEYTNEEMTKERQAEQFTAALLGGYKGITLLNYTSSETKAQNPTIIQNLYDLVTASPRVETVYTHNLTDKHPTHVAVALKTIAALRKIPVEQQPKHLYGCEVWRGLDWMCDNDKVMLDVSGKEGLARKLLKVFQTQIAGGKRYDLATMGRRMANATYAESHGVDKSTSLIYAMDLTPLIRDPTLPIVEYIIGYIARFEAEVVSTLQSLMK